MSAEPLLADDWRALAKALPLEQGLFIDGDFRQARSGRRFASVNPSNGETLAELPSADGQDVDIAVNSARRAFQSGVWSRRPPRERMAVLNRLADLIEQHQRTFALLDCLEMGKPISEMLTDGGLAPERAMPALYRGIHRQGTGHGGSNRQPHP
ncbi:aldehyde dehydrogenase family protein [Chromobacterium haemolyticum]|nr:aldehyde dehydrogenase family protein [Chromobacterium haemolyticum]